MGLFCNILGEMRHDYFGCIFLKIKWLEIVVPQKTCKLAKLQNNFRGGSGNVLK